MTDPPADLWPLLIHEAAHLIVAHRVGMPIKRIEVTIDGDRVDGYSFIDYDHARLSNFLTVLLAGETAEEEVFGRQMFPRVHAGSDREKLYSAVTRAGATGQQHLMMARQTVRKLVRQHRGAVIQLASDLMAMTTWAGVMVEGQQLAALLDQDGAGLLGRAAV